MFLNSDYYQHTYPLSRQRIVCIGKENYGRKKQNRSYSRYITPFTDDGFCCLFSGQEPDYDILDGRQG